jgi:RNA polymerase sigma factor (sigma-70 family)
MPNDETKKRLTELLPKLKKKPQDGQIWEELYANTRPLVFATTFRALSGNSALAEEATQQTFLRVFRYSDFTRLAKAEDLLAYLSTVARHCAIDIGKKEASYTPTALDALACDFLPSQATPEQRLRARETLQNVFDQLDPEEAKLVDLLVAELTLKVLAKELGTTYEAAGVRIHRLRERLRKLVKNNGL